MGDIDNDNLIEIIIGSEDKTLYAIDEETNHPPDKPEVIGPPEVNKGKINTWQFCSNDLNGDYIQYFIDWGDGDKEDTLCWESNKSYPVTHTYNILGEHVGNVYAKECPCDYGLESGITKFNVIVKNKGKDRIASNNPLMSLFSRFTNFFPILQILLQRLGLQN